MEQGAAFLQLDIDAAERFQRLRSALGVSTFGISLLVLQPGQAERIHRHERQEEVYLVLEGELSLYLEGEEHRVPAGGLVRVAPDVRRQLVNRRPQRLALLAFGGAVEHDGLDGRAYLGWEATESAPPQQVPLPDDVPVDSA